MRTIACVLALFLTFTTPAVAAFKTPLCSPHLAACGETLADYDNSAAAAVYLPPVLVGGTGFKFELAGQRLYSIPEFDHYMASVCMSSKHFGLGGQFTNIGDPDLYSETTAKFAGAYMVSSQFSAGLAFGYYRIDMGYDYESLDQVATEVSFMFNANANLWFYGRLSNPTEPRICPGTVLHRELRLGAVFAGAGNVNLGTEVATRSGVDTRFKIGEKLKLTPSFSINAGIITAPFVASLGFDVSYNQFHLAYAYRYHPDLEGTHVWGISLRK